MSRRCRRSGTGFETGFRIAKAENFAQTESGIRTGNFSTDIKKLYYCKITEKLSTKEIRDGCAMRGFEVTPLCLIINFTIPLSFVFFCPPGPLVN